MNEHKMMPKDIEKLLGISRSAMRYYSSKKLISSKRNPENNYSYYSGSDLFELIDVAFYRNCLNASAEEIKELTYADSVNSLRENYNGKIEEFSEKIRKEQEKLNMLISFRSQIDEALAALNRVEIKEFTEPLYLFYFDDNEHANIHEDYFHCSYWGSEFKMKDDHIVFDASCNTITAEYVKYLDALYPDVRYKKIESGRYLYTALTSDKEITDASHLDDLYSYAKAHGLTIAEPILLVYLFTFRSEQQRCRLYEAYMPIK